MRLSPYNSEAAMALDPIEQIAADVSETKARVGRLEATTEKTNEHLLRFEATANERLGRLELRLDVFAEKTELDFARVHQTLIRHDARFDSLESRFDSLETNMASTFQTMNTTFIAAVNLAFENFKRSSYEDRIARLEQAIFGNRT